MAAPNVIGAVALSEVLVRVTFDQGVVNDSALTTPAGYQLTPQAAGGAPSAVSSVAPEGVGFPTYVDLGITETTDLELYEVQVPAGIVNSTFEPIANRTAQFTAQGVKPQLSAAVALNKTKVRLTFDEPMDLNGNELEDPLNYAVVPLSPGALPVFVSSVDAIGSIPVSVELTTSEMKEGASYGAGVNSSGPIRDTAWNPLNPAAATAPFTGIGEAPLLARVEAVSETRVDVVFSEPMKDSPDIRDPASYVWDLGLTTIAVLEVAGDTVKLVTSPQTEGVLYTLTIG